MKDMLRDLDIKIQVISGLAHIHVISYAQAHETSYKIHNASNSLFGIQPTRRGGHSYL